jgi:F-type H+-transporting ATPase subunit epsilon
MSTLDVAIVTPRKAVWTGKASSVSLPAWEGEMGVLPGHDQRLVLLRGGVCRIDAEGGVQRFALGRGFAEIGATGVTLLAEVAETAEQVDKAGAAKDLADAEKALVDTDPDSPSRMAAEEKAEMSRARLAI